MKKLLLFSLVLFAFPAGDLYPEEKDKIQNTNAGIIYAEDHAFRISAPKGWVLDTRSGLANNLNVVFYPEGTTFETSTVLMYITTTLKDKTYNTLEQVMAFDIERFRKGHPGIKIDNAKPVGTGDKKKVLIKHFSGDTFGNYEAIGYLDEKKMVIFFVLTSRRNRENFTGSLKAFKDLIASYTWLADEVKFKKQP